MASISLKIFGVIAALFSLLIGISVLRALMWFEPPVVDYCSPNDKDYISESSELLERFTKALKFQTISYDHHNYERRALLNFVTYISKSFPLVHSSSIVSREVVNNFSLLYYVKGLNKELKPYMLAGHMDVVPVEESKWTIDPFGGKILDGFVWGRGTMDCKQLVMGILEALEFLLGKGYKPQRSFYLAFGHDEEVSGLDGAQYISKLLHSRGVKLEYILDEGSIVVDNVLPGIKAPIAFVGITEKGSLFANLTVNQDPGHSSLPSTETAIVILSNAVSKLKGDVFPSMFGKGPEKQMMEELAYSAIFPVKAVLANIWLFKPLIIAFMSSPVMSAFHRTTTAVTLIRGGTKGNVLPSSATATVNLRIHPSQTVDEALAHLKKIIYDDRVEVSVISSFEPHPLSPTDSFGYWTIRNSIRQIYNDSSVVPCSLMGNTDTRWYLDLTNSVYRFSLLRANLNDIKRVHGNDERIAVKNYVELVNFFVHLMKNSDEITKPKHVHTEL